MALKKMIGKRDKWVKDWPGQVSDLSHTCLSACVCLDMWSNVLFLMQMLITASQIQWTTDVTKSLIACKERADKSALKSLKKKQVR